jgi:integrase
MDISKHETAITFQDLTMLYLEETKKKNSGSTYGQRVHDTNKYLLTYFNTKKIQQIKPLDVKKWHTYIEETYDLSNNTLKRLHSTLSAILTCGMKYYNLPINAAKITGGFILKKESDSVLHFWEESEFQQFYAVIDELKYQCIFLLFYYSGLRSGELCALQWDDLQSNMLNISKSLTRTYQNNKYQACIGPTKTRKNRAIMLPQFLIEKLLAYKNHCKTELPRFSNDFYMFGNKNSFLSTSTLQRKFNKYIHAANVEKIKIHDLRHSHASYLINKNANIVLIAERLGHINPTETLNTYAHLFPSKQNEIINLIKDNNY